MTGRQLDLLPRIDPEPTGDQWGTPDALFALLDREFGFKLDVAALPGTAKTERFFTPADDGLARSWAPGPAWCNPPYSRPSPWCRKARQEALGGVLSVLLLKADPGTCWFQDLVAGSAEVRFLRGRVTFAGAPSAAPFPSFVAIYRPGLALPATAWSCWDWKACLKEVRLV